MSAVPGFALFLFLGLVGTDDSFRQPWLFVGLGTVLSATFLEPYFSTPRAAVVNAAGALAASVSAKTGSLDGLWLALQLALGLILVSGIVATIGPDGKLSQVTRQLAVRFGHAMPVGTSVLGLIILTEAQLGQPGYQELTIGTAVLVASISLDWVEMWKRATGAKDTGLALGAIGPRMILLSDTRSTLSPGNTVKLSGVDGDPVQGSVVARLPHPDGLRYHVALADEWTSVCSHFPESIDIEQAPASPNLVGAVTAQTTQHSLEFEPFRRLSIGDPLLLDTGQHKLLYQVARLRLIESKWSGSSAVVPRATATLIGCPEDNKVKSVAYLPEAHQPVFTANELEGALDAEYYEIGHIKGTRVPIGLRTDDDRRGHIAILGMSGMGKTALAQRICSILGADHLVVALDTTGEYRSRLTFPAWTTGDFNSDGHSVYEPAGDPPAKAKKFIEECMHEGASEYTAGNTPKRRFIALEEAHTFLPEWNVALRNQQDAVSYSTRLIMQARKFGLTFMLISQRTAVVSKSALSQCENYVILKTLDHTGLEYLESLVGTEMRDAIPTLERFEAMCVGPAFNAEEPVIVTLTPP